MTYNIMLIYNWPRRQGTNFRDQKETAPSKVKECVIKKCERQNKTTVPAQAV